MKYVDRLTVIGTKQFVNTCPCLGGYYGGTNWWPQLENDVSKYTMNISVNPNETPMLLFMKLRKSQEGEGNIPSTLFIIYFWNKHLKEKVGQVFIAH